MGIDVGNSLSMFAKLGLCCTDEFYRFHFFTFIYLQPLFVILFVSSYTVTFSFFLPTCCIVLLSTFRCFSTDVQLHWRVLMSEKLSKGIIYYGVWPSAEGGVFGRVAILSSFFCIRLGFPCCLFPRSVFFLTHFLSLRGI